MTVDQLSGNRALAAVEPLDPGYGLTLGNAIRRVLLSSTAGAAITEIEIDGVLHEYAMVDGAYEEVLEIVANLKALAIRMHRDKPVLLTLDCLGPGVVTAADIVLDHNVEIANPDQLICTLTKAVRLRMSLKVERGVGYRPVVTRSFMDESTNVVGRLLLDASFSPVRQVSYSVEPASGADNAGLERLVFDITTNGAVDVADAMLTAASILADQLSVFGTFITLDQQPVAPRIHPDSMLLRSVFELGLPPRCYSAIKASYIDLVGDLIGHSELELLMTPKLGKTGVVEIQKILAAHGLSLGTDMDSYPQFARKKIG